MTKLKLEKPANAFRRTGLFFGIGALVVIALTAGGQAWHRQPGFCLPDDLLERFEVALFSENAHPPHGSIEHVVGISSAGNA